MFKTKLSYNVTKIFYILKKRILIVQNSFSLALFSLFLGFLCGNLFGTFLDTLRLYFFWNGFVAFIILLFIEGINFFIYRIPLSEKINTNLLVSNIQNSSSLPTLGSKTLSSDTSLLCYAKWGSLFEKKKRITFTIYIERSINAFKIGLLFGFFIDSFKVGS